MIVKETEVPESISEITEHPWLNVPDAETDEDLRYVLDEIRIG